MHSFILLLCLIWIHNQVLARVAVEGDGYCDPSLNNVGNNFDGGDCCSFTCHNNIYGCGSNGYDCLSDFTATSALSMGIVDCDILDVSTVNYAGCDGIYERTADNVWVKPGRSIRFSESCSGDQFWCCGEEVACACASSWYWGSTDISGVLCHPNETYPAPPGAVSAESVYSSMITGMESQFHSIMGNVTDSMDFSGNTFGKIMLYSQDAFPLLKRSGRVYLAASRLGTGRVIAGGHGSVINEPTTAGRQQLTLSMMWWLSNRLDIADTTFGFLDGEQSGLRTWLEGQGATTQTFAVGDLATDMTIDVVVVSASTGQDTAPIRQWVINGGGLLTAATSWAWDYPNGFDDPTVFPGNNMIEGSGLIWHGHSSTSPGTVTPPTSLPEWFSNVHFASRLIIARASQNIISSEMEDALDEFADVVEYLFNNDASTDYFQWANETATEILGHIKPISVTRSLPLASTHNQLSVIEAKLLHFLPPALRTAYPSHDIFPGVPDPGAATVSRTLTINATYTFRDGMYYVGGSADVWRPTGLFARAGELITVTIPAEAVSSNLKVRISPHTDRLDTKEEWLRYPRIAVSDTLSAETTQSANAFGGYIFIAVPQHTDLGNIEVTIDGAVEAPLFDVATTTLSEWNETQRLHPAPTAVLVSDRIMIVVQSDQIRDLYDPFPLMKFWDDIQDSQNDLLSLSPYRPRAEVIVCDADVGYGYMHAGYPIVAPVSATEIVDLEQLMSSGAWGYFHELGHQHQWDVWTLSGMGEVSVNFFTLYSYQVVLNKTTDEARPSWNYPTSRRSYVSGFPSRPNFDTWKGDAFLALTTFATLADEFSWDLFRRTNANYLTMKEQGETWPSSNQDRTDMLVRELSKEAGYNLEPFFRAYGMDVSDAEQRRIARLRLPVWRRDPLLDLHGSPLVQPSNLAVSSDRAHLANRVRCDVSFTRADDEMGNNVTSTVTSYNVYAGNATHKRAMMIGSATVEELGGEAGEEVENPIEVEFETVDFDFVTVAAASLYEPAWEGYEVTIPITTLDEEFSATPTPSATSSATSSPTTTQTMTPSSSQTPSTSSTPSPVVSDLAQPDDDDDDDVSPTANSGNTIGVAVSFWLAIATLSFQIL